MILGLGEFYDGGRQACVLDVFGIGPLRESLGSTLADAVTGWTETLAEVLRETGLDAARAAARSEDAVVAVEGALVVSRALGETAPFQRTLSELPGRLLAAAT